MRRQHVEKAQQIVKQPINIVKHSPHRMLEEKRKKQIQKTKQDYMTKLATHHELADLNVQKVVSLHKLSDERAARTGIKSP